MDPYSGLNFFFFQRLPFSAKAFNSAKLIESTSIEALSKASAGSFNSRAIFSLSSSRLAEVCRVIFGSIYQVKKEKNKIRKFPPFIWKKEEKKGEEDGLLPNKEDMCD